MIIPTNIFHFARAIRNEYSALIISGLTVIVVSTCTLYKHIILICGAKQSDISQKLLILDNMCIYTYIKKLLV